VQELIQEAILRKAKAVLRNQRVEQRAAAKYAERYEKRTGLVAGRPVIADPAWWAYHPHFNPRYCIKHAKHLARSLWKKLEAGDYTPVPAIQFDVPKPDGSSRLIMAFAIPDSALANVIHRNATRRNINLFSAYSFAYRNDKNVFDAILHLSRSLSGPKSYIIQYDFSKYFDTIDHSYIEKILYKNNIFLLTGAERLAIKAFLTHRYAHVTAYPTEEFLVRSEGVPQGSSLSLFLSNAAAHELDLALERQNGSFVRFADDVVAITHSYSDALAVAQTFRAHCKEAGLKINYKKSPGILLFGGTPDRDKRHFTVDTDDGSFLETIGCVDYLGHRITPQGVCLPEKSISRIKRRISEIVYKHLFLHRRGLSGSFNLARIGPGFFDWDLVTCLNEIRKYVYGGLRQSQLEAFLNDDQRPPFIRGVMGFFPLTTNVQQLAELDGWLLNIVTRAQRERVRVISMHGHSMARLTKQQIISGSWYNFPITPNDTSLPSFVIAWRAARKYYMRYGLSQIRPPSYYSLIGYQS
jgi:retron-type reverse transcriptase